MTQTRRISFRTLALGGCAALALATGQARAEAHPKFEIASQDLKTALQQFASQGDQQVLFSTQVVAGKKTAGVSGEDQPEHALQVLLAGTGLTYSKTNEGALLVSDPQGGSAGGGAETNVVQELIVTAQKKEEAIQTVPIAISAFTQKSLEAQKIETGGDLLKAIPNVTFSKNNFSGYNFSIRGIGTKAVSVTTDPGVAVSFNSTTLIRNRLFEQEYFDVERVEVLRGPQGTLYGRNATSGVINVISAKPDLGAFSGMVKAEVGNYESRRAVGMINIPIINDKLAIRIAGSATIRDGYNIDLYNNKRQDGRNLWSGRVTIGFKPFERLRGNLIWEHFDENDDRSRTGKQLCTHDYSPDQIGDKSLVNASPFTRGQFTQGCLPGSLYDDKAFGVPNGYALPFTIALQTRLIGAPIGHTGVDDFLTPILYNRDPYGALTQSHDLRALYSQLEPTYRAQADVYELNFDFDITPALMLTSQTAFDKDKIYSTQDFNRYTTLPIFTDTSDLINPGTGVAEYKAMSPGGVFCDPQVGCSNSLVGEDLSRANSRQFSQELRLQSSFSGRWNFSAGLDYTRYRTVEDYYVFLNGITMSAMTIVNAAPVFDYPETPDKFTIHPDCTNPGHYLFCTPIENNPIGSIQDTGHNYFLSRNPYRLVSKAVFGEVYWQATDTLKVTAGLRYTDDQKTVTPIPSETLLTDPAVIYRNLGAQFVDTVHATGLPLFGLGSGYPALPDIHDQWKELTGRFGADWRPTLPFTDQTMLYAFYSRGYKGGGENPPRIGLNYDQAALLGINFAPSAPPNFRPEFVNAFEVGAKNTLLGGSLVLNGDAFFYDYKDYQVSKIVDRSANNENFDAKIWGLEFESIWQPTRALRFNASLGYLNTDLAKGSKSIDIMNRTAGHTDWVVVKPSITLTSNCIVPVRVADLLLGTVDLNNPNAVASNTLVNQACPGGSIFGETFTGKGTHGGVLPDGSTYDPADHPEANYGAGFDTDVSGNELPNAPHYTVSLGGQYSVDFLENWRATLRGDFYWQSQSWARIYELPIDKLHAWKNANIRLTFEKPDNGLEIELYVKNVFNDTPITDTFLNSDDSALTTNIFVLDPRIIGVSIKKTF